MIIVSRHICPTIPVRKYDWEAHYDNYEAGDPIGYGATKQQAIDNLKQQPRTTKP